MNQMSFSSQELFCMAECSGKHQMFGICDGFDQVPDEVIPTIKSQVTDSLIEKGVLKMDIDGRIQLAEKYSIIVSFICDAERCLIVNYQKVLSDRYEDTIFWRIGHKAMRADVIENQYVFSEVKEIEIKEYLASLLFDEPQKISTEMFLFPQIFLSKAKRIAKEESEFAAREYLLQHGAGKSVDVILSGLLEKADYLGIEYIDNSSNEESQKALSWIATDQELFELSSEIVNYRTCLKMIPCNRTRVSQAVQDFSLLIS